MRSQDSATTRLDAYIVEMLPWAHGHQRKGIRDFVQAIIDQQTGCQAQLARRFGNQEAATKRLSRLLHNERLEPRHLAGAVHAADRLEGGFRDPRQEEHQDLYRRRVAAARHAALCWQYTPSPAGASALLCQQSPPAVGDDESEA